MALPSLFVHSHHDLFCKEGLNRTRMIVKRRKRDLWKFSISEAVYCDVYINPIPAGLSAQHTHTQLPIHKTSPILLYRFVLYLLSAADDKTGDNRYN